MKRWLVAMSCLVLPGCRCRPPPEIVCEHPRYFVAPDLKLAEGYLPGPPTRLGQQIPGGAIGEAPSLLSFKDSTRVEIDWRRADLYVPELVIYSPQEQLGRSESQPGIAYWMRRATTESSDTVQIGFASQVCDDPESIAHDKPCWTFTRDRRPFVAELTCREESLPAR
jgi:hypothetical protein